VSESVLPSNVRALRKVLGDDRAGQHFIQTVYGRGYRFVAEIEQAGDPADRELGAAATAAPFVGREAELQVLREALTTSLAGRGSIAFIVGEAGIGKTRIAEEIAREARDRRARVLTGRCHEGEGAPAYWPWIQILRASLEEADLEGARRVLGREADEIVPLLPELWEAPARDDASRSRGSTSEQRRFKLFDAIARYLRRAARGVPIVVLLDDLHWADQASLLLLRFAASELRDSPFLLIGTYRDEELHRGHPLARVVGELYREPSVRRLHVQGLACEEVGRYLQSIAPGRATADLAAQLHERTAGNPFFLREMVHLIGAEATASASLPEGVREAIGRRLDKLSSEANRVLAAAAFLGTEFSTALLEQLVAVPRTQLLELLDEARTRGVLKEAGTPGRFAFVHSLVRETLHQEASAPVRVRMHRQVGEVLETVYSEDQGSHLAELAHHFFQAAAGGEVDKAVLWGHRAAERAMRLLAWEEAAAHYERILELQGLRTPVDARARCATLLDLGEARSRAGEREQARAAFSAAGAAARDLGDATLLARAALGLGGRAEELHGPDDSLRKLLEEALAAVGDSSAALRAALLARLAGTHPYSASPREREELSRQALELARASGARWALTQALVMRAVDIPPGDVEERIALGTELIETARRPNDAPWGQSPYDPAWVGHSYRHRAFLLRGDIREADRELGELSRIADEQRQPFQHFGVCTARFGRALAGARFAEAREWIDRGRKIAERLDPLTSTIDVLLEFLVARDCGSDLLPTEMAGPDLSDALRALPLDRLGWSASLAEASEQNVREAIRAISPWMLPLIGALMGHAKMQLGRSAEARSELASMGDLDEVARDGGWLFTLSFAAEVAASVGDLERAEALYALLEPHAAHNVTHGGLDVYFGSTHHFLGLLAAALGRRERAIEHLETALVQNERIGGRALCVRTQVELGRLLSGAARTRGRRLLEEGRAAARELGMGSLLT
jgi:tetratricopeptide (TPR) repeat protein